MRSYRHTAYALRAQDLAEQDRALYDHYCTYSAPTPSVAAWLDTYERARAAERGCCECGIGHVGACDSHAVQVALILAGVQRDATPYDEEGPK